MKPHRAALVSEAPPGVRALGRAHGEVREAEPTGLGPLVRRRRELASREDGAELGREAREVNHGYSLDVQ
jgi:hypothetical protein